MTRRRKWTYRVVGALLFLVGLAVHDYFGTAAAATWTGGLVVGFGLAVVVAVNVERAEG